MTETSATQAPKKPTARSRITNGRQLLPHVDGRSVWARRLRDVLDAHVADKGEDVSEAELSILRRAATLTVELEFLEAALAEARSGGGNVDASDLDLYQRMANSLRRLLESVGVERRQRQVGALEWVREQAND